MVPRKRYDSNAESAKFCAYHRAWDLLIFGYGRETWDSCGLSEEEANEVWELAQGDFARSL